MSSNQIRHLYTQIGQNLDLSAWDEYPRPQLRRESFYSLNGKWDFKVKALDIDTHINIPFAPESLLSGVNRSMGKRAEMEYSRSFVLPGGFIKDRVILHFGAVDQIASVKINGAEVGRHDGGYIPFSLDITEHIFKEAEAVNIIEVTVIDDISDRSFPYGKQRLKRGGMWYTPTSGIWQSVWIESVAQSYVRSIKYDVSDNLVHISVNGVSNGKITVFAPNGEVFVSLENGVADLRIEDPHYWSVEDPYLYELVLEAENDKISSYFALRTLQIKQINGIPRLCMNGKALFLHALLDQGYFSDGIYTPASPELYKEDILLAKSLGFNTLRKHIKIEPELFYYYCDKLGMFVMQDMVNNGAYSFIRDTALPTVFMKYFPSGLLNLSAKVRKTFKEHLKQTVEHLYNHPSIIYWTVFNEGWGQFNSTAAYKLIKQLDSSRFIDTASGWFKTSKSDVVSDHVYFKPVKFKKHKSKPTVLSEFGGYSYKHPEYCANLTKTYGYSKYQSVELYENALIDLYVTQIVPNVKKGLCGAVYTQLSDVEDETNGLVSYDRRFVKVDPEKMKNIAHMIKIEIDE